MTYELHGIIYRLQIMNNFFTTFKKKCLGISTSGIPNYQNSYKNQTRFKVPLIQKKVMKDHSRTFIDILLFCERPTSKGCEARKAIINSVVINT